MKALEIGVAFLFSVIADAEALATASNEATSSAALRTFADYHVLEEVPHDTSSFT